MSEQVFTDDEVKSLNEFQAAGIMHPFTCGTDKCRADLVATNEGWICPNGCGYTQNWAHAFMSNWSWKETAMQSPFHRAMLERRGLA